MRISRVSKSTVHDQGCVLKIIDLYIILPWVTTVSSFSLIRVSSFDSNHLKRVYKLMRYVIAMITNYI